eukprot:TRINITY_DN27293_c0_g1_i1.p1 TRINITY_DN27293_c0_g1~~TRINITY_DN27293_c0_g1_i1.p1  ORF type:complete len:476 (+),score=170.29 TRINITY_DN27293_c0_g1_i1:79-1506(+)
MPAAKRPREVDVLDVLSRETRKRTRGVRAEVLRVVKGGGHAAGVAYCKTLGGAEQVAALVVLAGVAKHDGVAAVAALVREVVEARCAGGAPEWAPEELVGLGGAVMTLAERMQGGDAGERGKLLCLLLRFPLQEFLKEAQPPAEAAEAKPLLPGAASGAASPTPHLPGDAAMADPEPRPSLLPSAPTWTSFEELAALPIAALRSRLGEFADCVRSLASQSEGGLASYPSFTGALAKVTDVTAKGDSAPRGPPAMMTLASGSVARGSPFSNSLHQTEVLLQALVKAHALLRDAVRGGDKGAALPPLLAPSLQSVVLGLTNLLGGADGAEFAVGEGMRDAAWAQWKAAAYPSLAERAGAGEKSNTVALAGARQHPMDTATAGATGFLVQDATPPQHADITVESFIGVAAMHMHPDAGMEKDYLVTRNFLYAWRASRFLLAGKDFRFAPDRTLTDHDTLEAVIPELYPDLGQQVIDSL